MNIVFNIIEDNISIIIGRTIVYNFERSFSQSSENIFY